MVSQLSTNGEALRLFFTEDIYLVEEPAASEPLVGKVSAAVQVPQVNTEPEAIAEAVVAYEKIEFKFLGKNKRNILILVNDDQYEVSNETGRELLRKIVKSVNLMADDFALLNYARYSGTSFVQLATYFNTAVVLAFGVSPSALALAGHPENTIVNEGAVKLVFSAVLPQLDEDVAGKKALWACLQNLGL